MDEMQEVIVDFISESQENLDELENDLLIIETGDAPREILDRAFRAMHTIKGTCGFLGFSNLEGLTHAAETLLSKVREGKRVVDEDAAEALYATLDGARRMLETITQTQSDGNDDYTALRQRMLDLAAGTPESSTPEPSPPEGGEPQGDAVMAAAESGPPLPDEDADQDTTPVAEEQTDAPKKQTARSDKSDMSIRVRVEVVDELMNLIGELVLTRNQIHQVAGDAATGALAGSLQRLTTVTSGLQESVTKTRMQPVGVAWNRIPRLVRDLARQCGKQVRIEMKGQETGLDRSLVEAIKDPLTHLVRNVVDHGIETPAQRRAAGKGETGCLRMMARHENGQVHIAISDDGRGIATDRVRAKAVANGVLTQAEADALSESEAGNLIFHPGLSTAQAVTNVSGRGVGMDVVRTNVEKLGGSVEVSSEPGVGTTFALRIPLTLAIVPALMIKSAGNTFAIPQSALVELVELTGAQLNERVHHMAGKTVFRLRQQLLPLVELSEVLREPAEAGKDKLRVVVLSVPGKTFGLVVDEVSETEEIVVKPLARQLKAAGFFSGATVMGDGTIALILDVGGVAEKAGVTPLDDSAATSAAHASGGPRTRGQAYLLTRVGPQSLAVPFSEVERIEKVPGARIERLGAKRVMQYRNQILPLVALGQGDLDEVMARSEVEIVVCLVDGALVGAVVDEVLDVEMAPESDIYGDDSVILQGAVTEVVHVSTMETGGASPSYPADAGGNP